ncbi:MAG: NGG1p interacting factor NIF3 [bacterium]
MMTLEQIYQLAIKMGLDSDLRSRKQVLKNQQRLKDKYDQMSPSQKKEFDQERLNNPYSDTRIVYGNPKTEIKRILVGVDIDVAELMLAKKIVEESGQPIDLCLSHHPQAGALAALGEVMDMQAEILAMYGIPINIAQNLLNIRIGEVSRNLFCGNLYRAVDAAKLLKQPLMCVHTPADNLVTSYLDQAIKKQKPEFVGELLELIKEIPEYNQAIKMNIGPRLFAGKKDNYVGKIAITEMTGGTSGSVKTYEKYAQAGIGTIVGMHMSEEYKNEAEKNHINVVISGHMASDSLGMNLFLDELEKKGIEIIPCSGLIRVSRNKTVAKAKLVKKDKKIKRKR